MFRCYSPHDLSSPDALVQLPRITVVGEHKDNELRIVASRCNLKDRFIRKIGREKAEKRLKSGFAHMVVKSPHCDSRMFHDLANVLMYRI